MKEYSKPTLTTVNLVLESPILTPSVGGGVDSNKKLENGHGSGDLTRGKQGFGKGMWEDMK